MIADFSDDEEDDAPAGVIFFAAKFRCESILLIPNF